MQHRLLAYNMETCIYLVEVPRPTTKNSHFSILLVDNPKNLGSATQNPLNLSPNKENTKYSAFFHLSIISIFRTEANSDFLGLDTKDTVSFSNNTGYTLQLQASTQLTMLWSVLGHNSSTIMTDHNCGLLNHTTSMVPRFCRHNCTNLVYSVVQCFVCKDKQHWVFYLLIMVCSKYWYVSFI